jgi:hypothetical protein
LRSKPELCDPGPFQLQFDSSKEFTSLYCNPVKACFLDTVLYLGDVIAGWLTCREAAAHRSPGQGEASLSELRRRPGYRTSMVSASATSCVPAAGFARPMFHGHSRPRAAARLAELARPCPGLKS